MFAQLEALHPLMPAVAGLVLLLAAALLADLAIKFILVTAVRQVAARTRAHWDDELVRRNVFGRLAQVVPALVVTNGVGFVPGISEAAATIIRNVASSWLILMLGLTVTAALGAVNTIYERQPQANARPIKGFTQLGQIAVYIVIAILIIATLIDRSPVILLSGFGAMTAVLLIVFRDTLLSLVASIQLTGQDMVRVGDWVEMPQFGADGDVIDVALYTVKVQNWDKTITTIPTHRLISDSFKNWRGMAESGGRRIKRSLYVDVSSIRFLSAEEVSRFSEFSLLHDYIAEKQQELEDYNTALNAPDDNDVNLRRLTNIGTLRAYIVNYLRHHPHVHQDMTLIVRQLQSGPQGMPLEIYCFTNDTNWVRYEAIQSDLFDHFCAILPEFGLRLYQEPAGSDVLALAGRRAL